MSFKTLTKKPLFWLYGGGIILLIVGGVLWSCQVMVQPERVFWGMIEQNLATNGITIQATQETGGRGLRQTVQYSLGASNLSHNLTTITQQGTVVRTEAIGTPKTDYTRYASIQTDQKNAKGEDLDLTKIVGVWAKGEGAGQLFPEAVLGTGLPIGGMVVPIGYLTPDLRAKLVKQINHDQVYQVDFKKVKKERVAGRQAYTYDVSIQTVAYAALMKQFAQAVGLHNLDQLDPNSYSGQQPLKLRLTVDARSRQLIKVSLPDQQYEQTYSAYDVPVTADLPKQTISVAELQQRLTDLQ